MKRVAGTTAVYRDAVMSLLDRTIVSMYGRRALLQPINASVTPAADQLQSTQLQPITTPVSPAFSVAKRKHSHSHSHSRAGDTGVVIGSSWFSERSTLRP
eukprot:228761-Prorocentrum_minimum.AAC.1